MRVSGLRRISVGSAEKGGRRREKEIDQMEGEGKEKRKTENNILNSSLLYGVSVSSSLLPCELMALSILSIGK